jgi:hypothetical protein
MLQRRHGQHQLSLGSGSACAQTFATHGFKRTCTHTPHSGFLRFAADRTVRATCRRRGRRGTVSQRRGPPLSDSLVTLSRSTLPSSTATPAHVAIVAPPSAPGAVALSQQAATHQKAVATTQSVLPTWGLALALLAAALTAVCSTVTVFLFAMWPTLKVRSPERNWAEPFRVAPTGKEPVSPRVCVSSFTTRLGCRRNAHSHVRAHDAGD